METDEQIINLEGAMYNKTVTVFNLYRSKQLGTATWYPHVIKNCYFNADKGANIQKTGLENADTAKLHIKYRFKNGKKMIGDLEYLDPKEWEKQTNDTYLNAITFKSGDDFFVIGDYADGPVDGNSFPEGFFQYMNARYDNVYRITTVGKYDIIPHFEIGGA